jgi:hypothetical protein
MKMTLDALGSIAAVVQSDQNTIHQESPLGLAEAGRIANFFDVAESIPGA